MVSENVISNDTVDAGAHVLLPAQAWGEKSGTVTNSERRISRQRAFLARPARRGPIGGSWPRWRKRLGFGAAFAFGSAADVFREHAALSAFENKGSRDFDIGAFASLSDDTLSTRWRRCSGRVAPAGREPQRGFFAEGGFFAPTARRASSRRAGAADRDHGRRARSAQHRPHPRPVAHHDAHRHEPAARPASAGALRRGSSRRRGVTASPTAISRSSRPITGNARSGRRQRAPAARHAVRADPLERGQRDRRACRFAGGAHTDPFSGQPENKATPASIAPLRLCVPGFCAVAQAAGLPAHAWRAARVAVNGGYGYSVRRQCRSGGGGSPG